MKISITIKVSDDETFEWQDSTEEYFVSVRKLQIVAPVTTANLRGAIKFGELAEEYIDSAVAEYMWRTHPAPASIPERPLTDADVDAIFPPKGGDGS